MADRRQYLLLRWLLWILLSDKGSAVVIWDRLDYVREGYRQLSDPLFYVKLDHNPAQSFARQVSNAVEDMFQNGELDQSVKDFLLEPVFWTPELYLLPQIHKADQSSLPIMDQLNASHSLQISILEFIRAPPHSPQGALFRNRVERNWTHLLRCLAPQGLNLETP